MSASDGIWLIILGLICLVPVTPGILEIIGWAFNRRKPIIQLPKPAQMWLGSLSFVFLALGFWRIIAPAGVSGATSMSPLPVETRSITPTELSTQNATNATGGTGGKFIHLAPFEYNFPLAQSWSQGDHEYTMVLECANPIWNDHATRSFKVDANAPLFQTPLYFRISGVYKGRLDGVPIDTIHPHQQMIASLMLMRPSLSDAEIARDTCNASVSIDGNAPEPLDKGEPNSGGGGGGHGGG